MEQPAKAKQDLVLPSETSREAPTSTGPTSTPLYTQVRLKPYANRNSRKSQGFSRNFRFPKYKQPEMSSINAYMKPSGFLTQITPHYEIQIQFSYLEELCRIVYETLRVREPRAVQFITIDQFVHTMKLCLFFKYYNYGHLVGTFSDRRLLDDILMPSVQQISGTLIPNIIADYIESVGTIKVDHIEVQPYVYSLDEFFDEHNIFYVLDEGVRTDEPCTFDNFMLQYSVGQYATSFVRVRTILHCLRCLDVSGTMGKPEILVETQIVNQVMYKAISHFSLASAIGHRGIVYRFWNSEQDRVYGDIHQFPHRFEGTNLIRDDYIRQLIANSIIINED